MAQLRMEDIGILIIRIRIENKFYFLSNVQKYEFLFPGMCTICEHTHHIIIYCVLTVQEQG